MTFMEAIQLGTSLGVLGHLLATLKWVIRVETRLAVIETQLKED
jgi:hypothetical protein